MCGIAGIVNSQQSDGGAILQAMLDVLAHRGPDGEGAWSDDLCSLGHRRLSIIDLSEAGSQPMSNEDGSVRVTFNGEIYNFSELRRSLKDLGHVFRSQTDTEVIVHAYEQWGLDSISRLRGMFAFGLWDAPRRRLVLARDRVGKKPLYFVRPERARGSVIFASEVQALLRHPDTPRETDHEAIDAYLSWGYVPAPRTGLSGVFKLLPGHWMTVDVQGDGLCVRTERYWRLNYLPKSPVTEAEAAAGLREKLTEAVRLRMVSDVPLGAFLSGGIDSSIVVGLMAQLSDRPVKTFSIGFQESNYNELPHARRIASRWSTDHHEYTVEADALETLPRLVRHYGEPYADSSAIPTYYVSRLTRSAVTVALNGDGGDEGFAGYQRYAGNLLAERIRNLPGARALVGAAGRLLPDSSHSRHPLRLAHRFLSSALLPMPERYGRWVSHFRPEDRERLYSDEFADLLHCENDPIEPASWMRGLFEEARDLDPVEAAMSVDVRSYLPFDLLAKVDIASMANSLEARSPFLDHAVMEFAASLPRNLKLRGRVSKYLLRRTFANELPRENLRRPKMGFGVPVGDWFRGPLQPLLRDTILGPAALGRGYFRPESVRRLVSEHLERRADHSFKLWTLLLLEAWHTFVEEVRPPVAT